jgi:hypothetical protein
MCGGNKNKVQSALLPVRSPWFRGNLHTLAVKQVVYTSHYILQPPHGQVYLYFFPNNTQSSI